MILIFFFVANFYFPISFIYLYDSVYDENVDDNDNRKDDKPTTH